jgi:hypothetical protein
MFIPKKKREREKKKKRKQRFFCRFSLCVERLVIDILSSHKINKKIKIKENENDIVSLYYCLYVIANMLLCDPWLRLTDTIV